MERDVVVICSDCGKQVRISSATSEKVLYCSTCVFKHTDLTKTNFYRELIVLLSKFGNPKTAKLQPNYYLISNGKKALCLLQFSTFPVDTVISSKYIIIRNEAVPFNMSLKIKIFYEDAREDISEFIKRKFRGLDPVRIVN